MGRSWVMVVAFTGCYAPAVPSEVPCGANDACPGGQVCDHGRPVPTCVDQTGDAGMQGGFDAEQVTIDAPAEDPLPTGAVMRLRFDDDPTDGVLDSQGMHVATCANATCPALVMGVVGGAYQFSADHVEVDDAADLRSSGGFTVAAWIQIETSATQEMMLVCKEYFMLAESYALSLTGANNVRLRFTGPNGALTGPLVVTRNVWHHVALTWDGSAVRLYFDGAPNGQMQQVPLLFDNGKLQIGACHGAQSFAGSIDDVQVYSRALDAAEITELAN
ncbi:MAG: LamG domain-containing protein [Kofleriaceae bacterium]|nr:LamG domain-containing protein [Kofleriaceae bacterium]